MYTHYVSQRQKIIKAIERTFLNHHVGNDEDDDDEDDEDDNIPDLQLFYEDIPAALHQHLPPSYSQKNPPSQVPSVPQPWTASSHAAMADDAFPIPTATPKRKRGDEGGPLPPVYTLGQFSFQLPDAKSDEDGGASPRSKVVHKFRGLALSGPGGGGVAQQQSTNRSLQRQGPYDPTRDVGDDVGHDDDPFASRKRMKVPELEMKDAGAGPEPVVIRDPEIKSDPVLGPNPIMGPSAPTAETTQHTCLAANDAATSAGLPRSYPFVNRVQDSKSRARRRAGTPPLKGRKGKGATGDTHRKDEDEEMRIVDPVRAALTWKEEEITVYDPDDKDDDGTGINGVGFMPTAAMAYARTQKRRMQLAEYRKREESDARARRSQRRRGSGAGLGVKVDSKPASGSGGGGVRKVRFMESEPSTIVTNG